MEAAEVPPPLAPPPPSPQGVPRSTALVVRANEGADCSEVPRSPSLPAIFLRGSSLGVASLPWASHLVAGCDWLRRPPLPLSGDVPAPGRASGVARLAV